MSPTARVGVEVGDRARTDVVAAGGAQHAGRHDDVGRLTGRDDRAGHRIDRRVVRMARILSENADAEIHLNEAAGDFQMLWRRRASPH